MSERVERPAPGVYRTAVLEGADPEGRGRVLVALPFELAKGEAWAVPATPFLPQPGDEVLVAFEGGDLRSPYVVGTLWDGSERPPEVRSSAGGVEVRDAHGNIVTLASSGITVTAAAKVTVAAGTVEISAGMLSVNAAMSRFSGAVLADTVITNSVVSASYTPGVGNVW